MKIQHKDTGYVLDVVDSISNNDIPFGWKRTWDIYPAFPFLDECLKKDLNERVNICRKKI